MSVPGRVISATVKQVNKSTRSRSALSVKSTSIYLSLILNCANKTDTAIARIKQLLKNRPDAVGLKIGVKQRGCSGLTYTLDYATNQEKHDVEIVKDNVKILIDRKAQLTLIGSEMDYVDSKISSEFVFNNPNITGMCGCGESFTIKK